MIKKAYTLLLTIMLCTTTALPQEKDNRHRVGDLTLTNTHALAWTCAGVCALSTLPNLTEEDRSKMLWALFGVAFLTTAGCTIVDTVNGIDHWINPANNKDPELKEAIKKAPDQKQ